MTDLSPASKGRVGTNNCHPRRAPAHLSVSLRHDIANSSSNHGFVPNVEPQNIATKPRLSPAESSDEYDSRSSRNNAQKWFEQSNKNPKPATSQGFGGDDSPYFLRRLSSYTSTDIVQSRQSPQIQYGPGAQLNGQASADESSADYRDVIDDLTIENKRLKEKLRKYEQAYNPEMDKHKLFEVKVHTLPARKRRELEAHLHAFASSIDPSSDSESPKNDLKASKMERLPARNGAKHSSSSWTSNSRPVDSAYASMSGSGPASNSAMLGVVRNEAPHQTKQENENDVQSFLHNIPVGLLPKHSPFMSERQKMKIVVRRLEQLFTGKIGVLGGVHSQPLQQQEVSESAARADHAINGQDTSPEGIREANMFMEVDFRPEKQAQQPIIDQDSNENSHDFDRFSPSELENEQRPTRPIDLDPDRAQVPADNIEYIRHLGQSTPQLSSYDSTDMPADAHGWIYLNLLINMAQLHIINVTPDFVRAAVQDVSEKFQLSKDGNKIRWRGGSKPTQLSSEDSGSSSTLDQSPHDSDSLEDDRGKRRKVDMGRFASIPVNARPHLHSGEAGHYKSVHYRPLFNHRTSSSEQSRAETASIDEEPGESRFGGTTRPQLWNQESRFTSHGKRQRDGGPIVFYSGAKFCTDLCGDEDIPEPSHDSGVGADGFSNHTKDALGCGSRPQVDRTPSGSMLPSRPFKQSGLPDNMDSRSSTPEPLDVRSGDDVLNLIALSDGAEFDPSLQVFEASGLGGTRPADHFHVRVETKRTNPFNEAQLSRFSAPGRGRRNFYHSIPNSALGSFSKPGPRDLEDSIIEHLASLTTFATPSPAPAQTNMDTLEEMPIKSEFISTKFVRLEPSQLPEPSGYYGASSTSEDDSEYGSLAGESHVVQEADDYFSRPYTIAMPDLSPPAAKQKRQPVSSDDGNSTGDDDDDDDDDDESIDMLGHEREINPDLVAAQEEEFEKMEIEARQATRSAFHPRSSVATIAESASGYSSTMGY